MSTPKVLKPKVLFEEWSKTASAKELVDFANKISAAADVFLIKSLKGRN